MQIKKLEDVRIMDILVNGPGQIFVGSKIKIKWLSLFMISIGTCTICWNLFAYLYSFNYIKKIPKYVMPFINKKYGKSQIQRIFNLCIMYPIFIYAYFKARTRLSIFVQYLSIVNIIFGFTYNANQFMSVYENTKSLTIFKYSS